MRLVALCALAVGAVACQLTVNGQGGAQTPDPNAQPQPTTAATNPTTPPPANTGLPVDNSPGRRVVRGVSQMAQVPPPNANTGTGTVGSTAGSGGTQQQAPVINGSNDFGSGTQTPDSFTGVVYYIPENTQKFPDVSGIKPSGVLYARQFQIAPREFNQGFPGIDNKFEWFAMRYTGAITVAAPGAYKIRVNSDDGAVIYIDGKVVLDNDGVHPPQDKSATVQLTAGTHPFQLDYFQGPRYQIALQAWVTPPNGPEKPLTTAW